MSKLVIILALLSLCVLLSFTAAFDEADEDSDDDKSDKMDPRVLELASIMEEPRNIGRLGGSLISKDIRDTLWDYAFAQGHIEAYAMDLTTFQRKQLVHLLRLVHTAIEKSLETGDNFTNDEDPVEDTH